MFRPGFLLALLVLLSPTVVGAEDAFIQPKKKDGALVHRLSNFSFPARIGRFHRLEPHQFDAAGTDIAVGYNMQEPTIVATLYVYPVGTGDLDGEFARRQKELTDAHASARLISQAATTVNGEQTRALGAEYVYSDKFGTQTQSLRSVLLVARRGDWFVEYRITYLAADTAESREIAERLTQDFAWP